MYAPREGRTRGRTRLLYWFRTPPDVRVGRVALDEEAIRSIEASNSDLTFDWKRILKARPPEPLPVERGGHERGGDDRPSRSGKGRKVRRSTTRLAPATDSEPKTLASSKSILDEAAILAREDSADDPAVIQSAEWIEGDDKGAPAEGRRGLPPGLHVEELLGSEGFHRLCARYAELLARIAERVRDPVRRDELRAQAERLDPSSWITEEEARKGIEEFDAAYEAIRVQLGRRRRRSRRSGGRRKRARDTRQRPPEETDSTGNTETVSGAVALDERAPSDGDSEPE